MEKFGGKFRGKKIGKIVKIKGNEKKFFGKNLGKLGFLGILELEFLGILGCGKIWEKLGKMVEIKGNVWEKNRKK